MRKNIWLFLIFVLAIIIMPGKVFAAVKECGDKETFLNLMNNADDGDIIKLTNNITLNAGENHTGDSFTIPYNCLVTLELQGNTIDIGFDNHSNNFGIEANSALLIKNGTIRNLDTNNDDTGILILSGVTVAEKMFLGSTQSWIVNNSSINELFPEDGSVNKTAANLNRILENSIQDYIKYEYENPAPAIIGSGVTWASYEDLQTDFNIVNNDSSTYNKVFLLKDSILTSNSDLTSSGITMDFSEYQLTTNNYFKISNNNGTNIIRNGTIDGNIDLTTGSGNVSFSNMNVIGNINNSIHTVNISSGHYNNISGGTGKITITDGYYKGTLSGNSYEISGGYYVNEPDSNYLKTGYIATQCNVISNDTTYNYRVVEGYIVNFNVNGHGTNPNTQKIQKGNKITQPTNPSVTGYIFEDWYSDLALTIKFDFDTIVSADMTLYAKWTEEIDNPKTGDNIIIYIGLFIISSMALIILDKKKNYN